MSKYSDIQLVRYELNGPVPSVSTPFMENGDIDWASLRQMVHFYVENGAKTILLTPGDSLYSLLSDREVVDLASFVVKEAEQRAMVIACGRQTSLPVTLDFARACRDCGADLFLPCPANWGSPDVNDLTEFFEKVAEIMPIMLVTATGPVPLNVFDHLIERKTPNFVAVKDDICGIFGITLAIKLDGRYGFLSGGMMVNHLIQSPYKINGFVSIYMRFCPKVALSYWHSFEAGDYASCASMVGYYDLAFEEMCNKNNIQFDAAIHGAMELYGLSKRFRRAPYPSVTDAQLEIVKTFLQIKGLL